MTCDLVPQREERQFNGDGKQMFGKQMFAGPPLTMGHREDFDQKGLTMFLPVYHTLVDINYIYDTIYDDISLPGAGPLSKFY